MKRCPHCEFIYEDDQSHCDMDGTKLAHDSRSLPKLQALSSTPETSSDSRWRGRAVPVFASAILAIVLGLVYYVSTRQVAPATNNDSTSTTVEMPANISTPSTSPAAPETTSLTDTPSPAEAKKETPETDAANVSIAGAQANKPAEQRTNKVNTSRNTKPAQQAKSQKDEDAKEPSEKDDSKMRSIIKKTGRFFKKTLPL